MLFENNVTVIVVHGAWTDGSSWNEVILAAKWMTDTSVRMDGSEIKGI